MFSKKGKAVIMRNKKFTRLMYTNKLHENRVL